MRISVCSHFQTTAGGHCEESHQQETDIFSDSLGCSAESLIFSGPVAPAVLRVLVCKHVGHCSNNHVSKVLQEGAENKILINMYYRPGDLINGIPFNLISPTLL